MLLRAPLAVTSTIAGFRTGDIIDLAKLDATALDFAGGTLTLSNGTTSLDELTFRGAYTAADFALSADGHGGTDVAFAAVAPATAHVLCRPV